jgi:hypothetical protein
LPFDAFLGQGGVMHLLMDGDYPFHQIGGVIDQGVAIDADGSIGPEWLDEQRHP